MKNIKLIQYTIFVAALAAPMSAFSYNHLPLATYQSHVTVEAQSPNHVMKAVQSKDLNSLLSYLESGDPQAQLYVAEQLYESAISPEENIRQSFLLTQAAAKQGNKDAQIILSKMYYHGVGTDINYDRAFGWMAHLDETTENLEAILEYAEVYLYGTEKIEPNIPLAIHWLKKAANRQHLPSIIDLAEIFENGVWIKPNAVNAKYYRLQAAKMGDANSQLIAAENYYHDEDYQNAFEWFNRSAASGMNEAKIQIGIMYLHGLGVSHDPIKAYVVLSDAASDGDHEAKKMRDLVAKSLDVDSLIEARKATRLFMQSKVL
ncbi:tetratricopeptide repeat protein [Photobacterium galatheae]|uniref:Sel1 repeat family protein n=1 Tax=Photobacterium galatheae TaxID=1654360 RepID=A0A066RPK1_9GAMM|nr:tetratricopeptide repeat protein [Photobacterium galatheae]KDM91041.1 hypothetical protein EA58_14940 [Photobacterium galatheae]MCM0149008.1 sel1 repeat family protein [Photobacterium galatheae]